MNYQLLNLLQAAGLFTLWVWSIGFISLGARRQTVNRDEGYTMLGVVLNGLAVWGFSCL